MILHITSKSRQGAAGLTLVEVLLATAILGIVFLAFNSSFLTARYTASMARNQMAGTQQARSAMEQLLANKFSYPELSTGIHTIANGFYVVSQDPGSPAIKEISLTILWAEPHSSLTSSVTLTSAISENLHK